MSIAQAQTVSTSSGGSTGGSTGSMTTAVSGSILLACMTYSGTFVSIADSKSNTWTQIDSTRQSGASAQNTRVYRVENATGGSSHTATLTLTGSSGWSLFFTEVTGGALSGALDVAVGASIAAAGTIITPTLTATAGNRLVVCYSGTTSGANPDNLSYNQSLVVPTNGRFTDGTTQVVSGLGTLVSSSFNAAITATYSGATGSPAGIIAFTLKELTSGAVIANKNSTGGMREYTGGI